MDDQKTPQTDVPTSEVPVASPIEQESTVEPSTAPPQSETSLPQEVSPAPKPRRKGLIIGLIVAVVLVVFSAAGVLAYNFWYQNPEKVVTDGLIHAMSTKTTSFKAIISTKAVVTTTMTLSGGYNNGAMNVDVDLKSKSEGKDYNVKGSGIFDNKGDLYVKVQNADMLINSMMGMDQTATQMPAGAKKAVSDFIAKVNNQWIKLSSDDVKGLGAMAIKNQKCLQDSFKKIQQDKAAVSELSDLYKKHMYITISKQLGSKDGSLGYELTSDKAEAKAFALGLKDTRLYKSLHDCDSNFTIDEKDLTIDTKDNTKSKAEVWVSRWTHELTKVNVSSETNGEPTTFTFEPTFNKPVTINTPDKSKTLGDLTKDFETLQSALLQEYLKSAGSIDGTNMSGADASLFSSQL